MFFAILATTAFGMNASAKARDCLTCGQSFWVKTHAPTQRYCSPGCGWAGRRRVKPPCQVCGSPVRLHAHKYCSNRCTAAARATRVERSCAWCGKPFYAKPSRIQKGSGKYCSRLCGVRGTHPPALLRCQTCNTEFPATKSAVAKGTKFCSWKCRGGQPPITLTCSYCGKRFKAYASHRTKSSVYCSKRCHDLSQVTRVTRTCERCGQVFTRPRSNKARFCSRGCARERRVLLCGIALTMDEVARLVDCPVSTILARMKRGEARDEEEAPAAFFRPSRLKGHYTPASEKARERRERRHQQHVTLA